MNGTTLRNLETVTNGLGDILEHVVSVGGATVEFYATETGAPQARPTFDNEAHAGRRGLFIFFGKIGNTNVTGNRERGTGNWERS